MKIQDTSTESLSHPLKEIPMNGLLSMTAFICFTSARDSLSRRMGAIPL